MASPSIPENVPGMTESEAKSQYNALRLTITNPHREQPPRKPPSPGFAAINPATCVPCPAKA
jgi:hypothetical protein